MVGPAGKPDYLKASVKPVRIHGSFSWLGWEDGKKSSLSGPITMWSHSPYPTSPGGGVSEQSLTKSLTLHVFRLHMNPSWPLLEVTSWLYCLGNNEELSLAAEPGVLCPCFSTKGQLPQPTDACQPARNLISDPGVQLTCNTSMLRIVWVLARKCSFASREGRAPGSREGGSQGHFFHHWLFLQNLYVHSEDCVCHAPPVLTPETAPQLG